MLSKESIQRVNLWMGNCPTSWMKSLSRLNIKRGFVVGIMMIKTKIRDYIVIKKDLNMCGLM